MKPHPWLEPLHRRVITMLFCLGWLGFETWLDPGGLFFWLIAAASVFALWDFFLSGNYPRS